MPIIAGRYELGELIGQGGMGQVFRGHDLHTGQAVAIKLLKHDILRDDPGIAERFEREAEALRKLDHPGVVKMLATGVEQDQRYIVMEYVAGGSLADLLKRHPLPIEYVITLALDISDALTRVHRLNITHRDIKPANILIGSDQSARLTDFGVAQIGDRSRLTQSGSLIGTYLYLSPEACHGERLDARTDIWSFGVVLFEMLAGSTPFYDTMPGVVLTSILHKPTPDLRSIRPDAPEALVDLIERMLIKDREKRLQSIRMVGAALEAIQAGRVGTERAIGATQVMVTPAPTPTVIADARFNIPTRIEGMTPKGLAANAPTAVDPPTPPVAVDARMATPLPQPTRYQAVLPQMSMPLVAAIIGGMLLVGLLIIWQLNLNGQRSTLADQQAAVVSGPPATIDIQALPTGKYLILVAPLTPTDTGRAGVDAALYEDLRRTFEDDIPDSPLVVRQASRAPTSVNDARSLAEAANAVLIIWGNYDANRFLIDIQVGSLTPFRYIVFDRKLIERTTNIRLSMTDPNTQTIAPQVLAALQVLETADGNTYALSRNAELLNVMRRPTPDIPEGTVASGFQRWLKYYFSNTEQSIREVGVPLSLDPQNPILYAIRAVAYQRLGRFGDAAQDIETTAALDPTDRWAAPYVLRGMQGLLTDDIDRALDGYSAVIERRPDDWYILYMRSALKYYYKQDLVGAQTDIDQALRLNPKIGSPYMVKTILNLRAGQLKEAIDLQKVVKTQFTDPDAVMRQAQAFYGNQLDDHPALSLISSGMSVFSNRYEDAVREADAAIVPDIPNGDGYFIRGFVACAQGKNEQAIADLNKALEISPDFILLYLIRAGAYNQQGNLLAAQQDLERIRQSPQRDLLSPYIAPSVTGELTCANVFSYNLANP